jgi:small subunit ribosomal protein S4
MSKRLQSKYSVCKKLSNSYKNLWGLKSKDYCRSVLIKKKKKLTSFGKLLDIKQSFKFFYSNIGEHLFKNYIKCSIKSPSKTTDKLVSIMESRLDSVLFRSCLVDSFQEARQLINHKFITVNGLCIRMPDKKLNKGDIIKLNILQTIDKESFNKRLLARSIPNYLELDLSNSTIVFLWDVNLKNVYYPINVKYSNISRYYK